MNPVHHLHKIGQSIWFDNIERKLLINGDLKKMISKDIIRGVTSNPSILNNAISKSNDYDREIESMAKAGRNKEDIYDSLVVADIQTACDLFQSLYMETERRDGYVSLEVSPYFANDTEGTINDAKRLWKLVDRPNLMIKIPATEDGLPAITQTISEGINVNVTLIFSIDRYQQVIDAYLTGLEMRQERNESIEEIASVASFFVSRIDTNVDNLIEHLLGLGQITLSQARKTQGKIAIASAKIAYSIYKKFFNGERFRNLEHWGGRVQRPLWASTSTKNPAYPDTRYVDELIGPNTVNTLPPHTLVAFQDHGKVELTLEVDLATAKEEMNELADMNISIDEVTEKLEIHGVKAFADSFSNLLNSIEYRRSAIV
jgi:transaldolase